MSSIYIPGTDHDVLMENPSLDPSADSWYIFETEDVTCLPGGNAIIRTSGHPSPLFIGDNDLPRGIFVSLCEMVEPNYSYGVTDAFQVKQTWEFDDLESAERFSNNLMRVFAAEIIQARPS